MRKSPFFLRVVLSLTVVVFCSIAVLAQSHTVAVTIDDLPFVGSDASPKELAGKVAEAQVANRKLLAGLARHHVPVTGFVIQKGVEDLGVAAGTGILREWIRGGLDLANHSYAHPDFNGLTIAEGEDQIVRGEAGFLPLMQEVGRSPRFFRFPMNHTGDTKEKHEAWAAFLTQRGFQPATCTIETADWMFNIAYGKMLAHHDKASAARLRKDYLAFAAAQVDYFDRLNKQVLGYDAPQVMLIHDDQLNADVIDQVLAILESRHYRFVTLTEAQSDKAYQGPESFVTNYGPMWAYRWARERGVKVDGSLEPEPPKWIVEYGQKTAPTARRPRSQF